MLAAVTNVLCRLLLACALALSSVGFGSSTTTASAAAFTYDAKVVARVDIHASEDSLAERSQFTGLQGRFTSRGFSAPGTPTTSSVSFVATNTAGTAFHHTTDQAVESIMRSGLRPGSYATPTQGLSPLQAHIELALNPAGGARNAVLQIDVAGLRTAGYEIPTEFLKVIG